MITDTGVDVPVSVIAVMPCRRLLQIIHDEFHHFYMVVAAYDILPIVFQQLYAETLAAVGIVTEILADDDVAEISPIAKETSASAQP
jgi:hypothetical protein